MALNRFLSFPSLLHRLTGQWAWAGDAAGAPPRARFMWPVHPSAQRCAGCLPLKKSDRRGVARRFPSHSDNLQPMTNRCGRKSCEPRPARPRLKRTPIPHAVSAPDLPEGSGYFPVGPLPCLTFPSALSSFFHTSPSLCPSYTNPHLRFCLWKIQPKLGDTRATWLGKQIFRVEFGSWRTQQWASHPWR